MTHLYAIVAVATTLFAIYVTFWLVTSDGPNKEPQYRCSHNVLEWRQGTNGYWQPVPGAIRCEAER